MIVIIAYDISSDRRRAKVVRTLQNLGERIQYSVFECDLSPERLQALQSQLAALINPRRDRIHLYPICQACFARAISIGVAYTNQLLDL